MSSTHKSAHDYAIIPAAISTENDAYDEDLSTEEVDLESSEGRAELIQEIENLALTCDVADDPDLFAESEVFALVAELQTALINIEETQLLGEEITDIQAQAIQDLYDQLAIEVEQPAIISVYVGPSRKDMVLEDLGQEESIIITQSKKAEPEPVEVEVVPEHKATFIHNRLPDRPIAPAKAVDPKPAPARPETLYKADAPDIALQKVIDKIEAAEVSFLDAWINDYQSPYKVLGEMPFAKLAHMAAAPVNSRTYVEFKSLLELQKIKYEVFNQWSQQFADMEQVVDRAQHKSFKQVVDEYLTDSSAA